MGYFFDSCAHSHLQHNFAASLSVMEARITVCTGLVQSLLP